MESGPESTALEDFMKRVILVCDASRARLFVSVGRHEPLQLLRQEDNPAGRATEQELRTDEPGRYRKGGQAAALSAMDPHTTAHEVESEKFARHLAAELKKLFDNHEYDSLVIAAPPHLLGLLRDSLSSEVRHILKSSVAKDLTHMDERELREEVGPILWPGS
jgi:protein required for attachment to host cells